MLALLAGAPALLAFGSIAALLLFLVWFSGMLPGWQVPPWKTPYGVAALLYVTCVVLAWRMPWHYAAGDRNFLAASDLPHNHRIRPADLKAPPSFPSEFGFYLPSIRSIAGKYVVVPCLRAGQKVTPASVAAGPDLELPNRNRAISFPLPPEAQFIGDMEPGTTVSLLGQDADTKSAIKILATVHAIVCDKPDTAGELCMPVLYLDDDQIDMTTRNKAALRVALVSPAAPERLPGRPQKMTQPLWRNIVQELAVPEPQYQWKLAVPLLSPGKVMMVEVVVDAARNPPITGTWTPKGSHDACTADGYFSLEQQSGDPLPGVLPVGAAPRGALIARIGGSTADQGADSASPPARIVFSIGRKCIFTVPTAPAGSLFLGVNDAPAHMAEVTGQLFVNIFEAL